MVDNLVFEGGFADPCFSGARGLEGRTSLRLRLFWLYWSVLLGWTSLKGYRAGQVGRNVQWTDSLLLEHLVDLEHLVKLLKTATLFMQPTIKLKLAYSVERLSLVLVMLILNTCSGCSKLSIICIVSAFDCSV